LLTSASRSSSFPRTPRAFAAAFSAASARSAPNRSSSETSCARSPSSSRSIRAPSSAACAWRLSGRSRARGAAPAVEVVAGGAQLQLGPPPALAVLAEAGGLLDQEPPLFRLRVDDRLDPALADHRVHLAAEVGVGEDVGDVGEAAAGAVQPVAAVAGAVEAALDGDLGELGGGATVGVVDHDLDLGGAALADAFSAGGDHVLHRGAADRAGTLLAEGPEDGVGDVALAGAVGTDDHAHPGRELQGRPLREALEPLHRDRSQIHPRAPRIA
jgi:hypothetical protein